MSTPSATRWNAVGLCIVVLAVFSVVAALFYWLLLIVGESAGRAAFGPNAPPGPLADVGGWPEPMQILRAELEDTDVKEFDGYLLSGSPGGFSVDEAVFRVVASKSTVDKIIDGLHLIDVDNDHRWVRTYGDRILEAATDAWWPKSNANEIKYFVSQGMLDGDEGDLYVAAYDETTGTLYLYYWFNF